MGIRFIDISAAARGRWSQLQLRGIVSLVIGISCSIMNSFEASSNGGARTIMGVASHYSVARVLQRTKEERHICSHDWYCRCIVTYVFHCFRHPEHPVTKLLSLPFGRRLSFLRSSGLEREPSAPSVVHSNLSLDLGLQPIDALAGQPNVQGAMGICSDGADAGWGR